jgi:hypothetical protein
MRISGDYHLNYLNTLSEAEKRQVEKLRQRDTKVHNHEQAHISAGGTLITGSAKYKYQTGPDGKQYAVGGEVGIRIPEGKTPEEDLRIAIRVERTALAPVDPSAQDRAVAYKAQAKATNARKELAQEVDFLA